MTRPMPVRNRKHTPFLETRNVVPIEALATLRGTGKRQTCTSMLCSYCSVPELPYKATLVTGGTIYPHRDDLLHLNFWLCNSCGAYTGTHQAGHRGDGTVPKGRLADKPLRAIKMKTHTVFDDLWKKNKGIDRAGAYRWLAHQLELDKDCCHIGLFDYATCEATIELVRAATPQHVKSFLYAKTRHD